MSKDNDEDPPKLHPIPGAPDSAPNPHFPRFRVVHGVRNGDSDPGAKLETEKPIPSLQQMVRDGRASMDRARRGTQVALIEYLDQAERLWLARTHYGLGGDRYVAFAASIMISRSDAFELVKLHPHRAAVLARVFAEDEAAKAKGIGYTYPGWKRCLSWFKPKTPKEEADADEAEEAEDDEHAGEDAAAEIERLETANNDLEERLAVAQQQTRSERIAREEAEERVGQLTDALAEERRQRAALQAMYDALEDDYAALTAHQSPAWEEAVGETEPQAEAEPEPAPEKSSTSTALVLVKPEHEPEPLAQRKRKRGRPPGSKNKRGPLVQAILKLLPDDGSGIDQQTLSHQLLAAGVIETRHPVGSTLDRMQRNGLVEEVAGRWRKKAFSR